MTRDILLVPVAEDMGPDAPAAGLHYQIGGAVGLLVRPRDAAPGKCWWCGATRPREVPLCRECRSIAWGVEDVKVVTATPAEVGA